MNKAYWNEIAARYNDEIFSVYHEDRNGTLKSYLDKHANTSHTAVDFGCGIGKAFDYLSPRFKKIIGIDFSENLLETAKLNAGPEIELRQADLTIEPLKLPSADFAFCCNVAMFPEVEKNLAILRNISRAMKKNASALFVLPSLESMISKSWMTAEWFRKDGVPFEEIPRSQWSDYKYGAKSFLLGLINIDGVITKHYLRSEIIHLFDTSGLSVKGIDKLEYDWDSEFESPPDWMRDTYPWDWLVECERK